MGQPRKPARLAIRTDKTANGKVRTWEIRDGAKRIRTGCLEREVESANRMLQDYLGQAKQAERSGGNPASIKIADVLMVYMEYKNPSNEAHRGRELLAQIGRLNNFFGAMNVSQVNGANCRAYTAQRTTEPMARNELTVLRASLNHYHREHVLDYVPLVTIPNKPPSRHRWLTRNEAARILWQLWKAKDGLTGVYTARHLARFFLIAIYTGTREKSITALQWRPNTMGGHVDLEQGVIYRAPEGHTETKKRRRPLRIPRRLLPHLRRWQRDEIPYVIHHWGKPVKRANATAWGNALKRAGLDDQHIKVHTLKHTCATWLMQAGVDIAEAASFLSTSVQTIERVYFHHHPDYQSKAAEAF